MAYEGGCLCGAVRYRIDAEPLSAGYCYCRMCQRAAGAPVVAWVAFPRMAFSLTRGQPHELKASARATRRFCAECGTHLTFQYSADTKTIDVTIASLDDPRSTEPLYEIWTSSRPPWLGLRGEGPSFSGDAP